MQICVSRLFYNVLESEDVRSCFWLFKTCMVPGERESRLARERYENGLIEVEDNLLFDVIGIQCYIVIRNGGADA